MSTDLVKSAITKLTPLERRAYDDYIESGKPPLSPTVQATLFELYLNGSDTHEIARLNKNFSLGMIVRAKVEGLWDERRVAHVSTLLETVRERVQQVQLESVVFSADLLAAANKRFGDKLKRFIQTGDEKELGGIQIDSLKQYKEAVDLLLKLTGQDKQQNVKVSGGTNDVKTVRIESDKPMTPAEAAAILTAVENKK